MAELALLIALVALIVAWFRARDYEEALDGARASRDIYCDTATKCLARNRELSRSLFMANCTNDTLEERIRDLEQRGGL